jgi:peptidoglycan/xylan/chitin deacetylase (PgdA/CDA1 family)
MGVALWSVDSGDWAQLGEAQIVGTVLAETKPGSIVICHDLYKQTADGMGPILDGLLERGSALETLSTLLR